MFQSWLLSQIKLVLVIFKVTAQETETLVETNEQ